MGIKQSRAASTSISGGLVSNVCSIHPPPGGNKTHPDNGHAYYYRLREDGRPMERRMPSDLVEETWRRSDGEDEEKEIVSNTWLVNRQSLCLIVCKHRTEINARKTTPSEGNQCLCKITVHLKEHLHRSRGSRYLLRLSLQLAGRLARERCKYNKINKWTK